MGLILAGILLGALIFGGMLLYASRSRDPKEFIYYVLTILTAFCIICGVVFGILEPVSGYTEPKTISTIELVSLRDNTVSEGTGSLLYVSISGANSYTYYVEIDSPYASNSQKAYKSITISNSNVTILEDDSYTDAKLITYARYGKKSFWTFALGATKYEYVFYVPTGTIAQNVSLG